MLQIQVFGAQETKEKKEEKKGKMGRCGCPAQTGLTPPLPARIKSSSCVTHTKLTRVQLEPSRTQPTSPIGKPNYMKLYFPLITYSRITNKH